MKKEYIFIIIAVLLVVLIFIFRKLNYSVQVPDQIPTVKTTGLQVTDLKEGTGEAAKVGDKISVNYIGTLENGQKFDSSYDRNKPFQFTLGKGEVIAGWDQGLVGMKVGGKRKLVIPPELGYGANSKGLIPANAVLIFEVDFLEIIK